MSQEKGWELQQLLFSENCTCIRIKEGATLPIPKFLPDEAGSKDWRKCWGEKSRGEELQTFFQFEFLKLIVCIGLYFYWLIGLVQYIE